MRDIGASVLARLKDKAQDSGMSAQVQLRLFCQEEFMRRLALSDYADNLVLKGGLLLFALSGFESRATIDIDFLLKCLPGDAGSVQRIVEKIVSTSTGNDFITFEMQNFREISPHRKYKGISFQLVGRIKNTQTPFNVDFGIGDVVIPRAEKRRIPTQLGDFEAPEIGTYSLESTVAEKFDAILERMELTSRMKDYYDLHFIATTFGFDGRVLQEAIMETLQNRGTVYDASSFARILSFSNNTDMLDKWQRFLERTKLPSLDFAEVIDVLELFLSGIWDTISREDEWLQAWDCQTKTWSRYGGNDS
jgi:predicted nucleotidyltransferase component of viral defense system